MDDERIDRGQDQHQQQRGYRTAESHVHSVRQSFGTDIIVTKNIVTNDKGDVVQEAYTTLAGRTAENGEEGGFSDGAA